MASKNYNIETIMFWNHSKVFQRSISKSNPPCNYHVSNDKRISENISEMYLRIHSNNIRRYMSISYFDQNRVNLIIVYFRMIWVHPKCGKHSQGGKIICPFKSRNGFGRLRNLVKILQNIYWSSKNRNLITVVKKR